MKYQFSSLFFLRSEKSDEDQEEFERIFIFYLIVKLGTFHLEFVTNMQRVLGMNNRVD